MQLALKRRGDAQRLHQILLATKCDKLRETRNQFDIRALTRYMVFDSWYHLMDFMIRGLELDPKRGTS